jgi:peroxiredoxin
MRRNWMVLAATAVVAGLVVHGHSLAASAAKVAEIGQTAPDFALKDIYGKEFKLSEFKGKILVLEWMNRTCPVSTGAHEKQQMQRVYRQYAGKGVAWLAVDSTEAAKAEDDRVHAAEYGLAYPILLDPDAKAANAYGARRTPHMFVIDKDGKLAYAGAIDDKGDNNYVAAAIENLLAGKTVSKPKTEAYGCGVKNAKLGS